MLKQEPIGSSHSTSYVLRVLSNRSKGRMTGTGTDLKAVSVNAMNITLVRSAICTFLAISLLMALTSADPLTEHLFISLSIILGALICNKTSQTQNNK